MPHLNMPLLLILVSVTVNCPSSLIVAAEDARNENPQFYESDVQGILAARCVRCHNSRKAEAGLDLSTPSGILRGGESGRVLRDGVLAESLLFQKLEAGEMPPDEKDRLTPEQLASIRSWIASGARFRATVQAAPEITQHDVIPLLYLRCVPCHGNRRQEAGLDLRSKAAILQGGKSGPAVVPGKPEESLLLRRIRAGDMPPRRQLVSVSVKPMEDPEVEKLARWIERELPEEAGPADPTAARDSGVTDEDRRFWSFLPPRRPAVPTVRSADRVGNPIDAFILQRLEEHGLALAPEADRSTLVRRIYFDLTGLPPTPDDVDTFLQDGEPRAYERLVERLLASPRYGERWARHWLDVAGYADSEGAQNEDRVRPHMYRYRDYVIRSWDSDKPYSRFLQEQIAGDELAPYEDLPQINDEIYDNLVATGFLRTAPDRTFANITNFVPDRLEVIADEMEILGSSVLGLTLKCARCHSHKFDPIPQQDYYRLTAIFKDAYDEHDWLKSQGERTLPHVTAAERQAFERHEQQIQEQIEPLRETVRSKTEAVRRKVLQQELVALPEELREPVRAALKTAGAERTDEQKDLLAKHAPAHMLSDDELRKRDPQLRQECQELEQRIKELEAQRLPEPRIRALWSRGEPSPSYVLQRGNYLTPGRPVEPGVPSALATGLSPLEVSPPWPNARSTGRRLAFARWLTHPDHPLTARVMVNRIWRHHFGRGIVGTTGNFGKAGERPTHPELLDWLAVEFVRSGWSIKTLHRLIITSSTYRQSSDITEAALRGDPDGSLLSRMPLRRLEAEVLRDALLSVSGALNTARFGPGDPVEVRADGLVTARPSSQGWRRSIYVLQRRTQIPTLLDNFDYPQMGPNCLQRGESLVAPQALQLMNDGFVFQLAEHFADGVWREVGADRDQQIRAVYLRALGRQPTPQELAVGLQALDELGDRWRKKKSEMEPQPAADRQALVSYCHGILNLAEFLYVE